VDYTTIGENYSCKPTRSSCAPLIDLRVSPESRTPFGASKRLQLDAVDHTLAASLGDLLRHSRWPTLWQQVRSLGPCRWGSLAVTFLFVAEPALEARGTVSSWVLWTAAS